MALAVVGKGSPGLHDVNLFSHGAARNYALAQPVVSSGDFGSVRLHIEASANASGPAEVLFEAPTAAELLGAAAADARGTGGRAAALPAGRRGALWLLASVAMAGLLAATRAGAACGRGARRDYRGVAAFDRAV
ncbi:unnamed protein product [Prorocentrum cordatum]|uniref:Uncharacterized protein n=1 Tax=Prorocentrum cordatum TaxID=2364126 RepID=A0ABN9R241_9DINO|nr:unnamed protein product [Polarella glacialis]